MPATLRIAIVGGSISGCTLANGLLHLENVTFDVFESKESFSERGAAIAMHTNALASLKSAGLDPDRILKDGLGNKRGVLQTIVVRRLNDSGWDQVNRLLTNFRAVASIKEKTF